TINNNVVAVGLDGTAGGAQGILKLGTTSNSLTAATSITVGDSVNGGNTGLTSQLVLGAGTNTVTTPRLTVGRYKSLGSMTINPGGRFTMSNAPAAAVTISAATFVTTNCTITTAVPHSFVVGQQVTIANVTPPDYNGTFTITAVNQAATNFN